MDALERGRGVEEGCRALMGSVGACLTGAQSLGVVTLVASPTWRWAGDDIQNAHIR